MRFRFRNLLTVAIVILGVLLCAAPSVYAAYDQKTSEECIKLIKEFEGFQKKAFYDYSQWSIGYGTACGENEYPNGVTEAQADQLLRDYVATLEDKLNRFAKRNKLELSQNQFDALISFSYNVGINWVNDGKQLITSSVVDQATGNDMIFALGRWCLVTERGVKEVSHGLLNRRLIEANMYLNGEYVNSVPSNYRYVIFEENTDECVNETHVQAYDNTVTDVLRAVPSKKGYVFLGWYNQANGGQWVTHVGPDTKLNKLYAHWQKGTDDTSGVAANYVRYGTGGNIYGYPSFSSTVVGVLNTGESTVVMADYIDANGVKWGKLATSKWVCLAETVVKSASAAMEPVEVKVICDYVNIRTGPGTGYEKAGKLSRDSVILLTEIQQNGNYKWGKFDEGWVCLDYTDYDQVLADNSGGVSNDREESVDPENQEPIIAKGIVGKCSSLRIRAGAGTTYDTVGSLHTGDPVNILEFATVNGLRWGRISDGWICLSYVQLDSENSSAAVTGKVINCSRLNVRAAPGVSSAKICSIANGTVVTVYEQATAGGDAWGRIDEGWVHMDYIYLGNHSPSNGSGGYMVGTIYNTDVLRVRKGAGVDHAQVGSLQKGTVVIITETVKVGTTTWGKIDQGWISLHYVKLDSGTVPVDAVTKTVNTKSLRIRAGAGTNYECVGSYVSGDQVVITDQTMVKDRMWGRTDKGWICMEYVI